MSRIPAPAGSQASGWSFVVTEAHVRSMPPLRAGPPPAPPVPANEPTCAGTVWSG